MLHVYPSRNKKVGCPPLLIAEATFHGASDVSFQVSSQRRYTPSSSSVVVPCRSDFLRSLVLQGSWWYSQSGWIGLQCTVDYSCQVLIISSHATCISCVLVPKPPSTGRSKGRHEVVVGKGLGSKRPIILPSLFPIPFTRNAHFRDQTTTASLR